VQKQSSSEPVFQEDQGFSVIFKKDKHLIVVTVPEGNNKPYYLDGTAYMRVGTENRVIPPDELKRIILSVHSIP
jgi:ATP-dependent DNA helicase RecG